MQAGIITENKNLILENIFYPESSHIAYQVKGGKRVKYTTKKLDLTHTLASWGQVESYALILCRYKYILIKLSMLPLKQRAYYTIDSL